MRNKLFYLLLIILIAPSFWWLTGSGYFNMHDDLQVMRLFQMDKCLMDGQIPCRWSPDMVWGYGQPMFNFYSALPYYLGALMRIITSLNYLATVKGLFLLSFIIAAIGMYKLAREFWGNLGGILSAILYTYAPYHALDIYVRGALSETYALTILPWMWYFLYKLINKYSLLNFVGTVISITFILTSHNISTMLYALPTLAWCVFWLTVKKQIKPWFLILFSSMLGICLAAFFIIPALVEQNIIQTQYLTTEYSNYRGHFVTVKQLFYNRNWGDGPSIYGDKEDISFQIGWPHWWLGIVAVANGILLLLRKKLSRKILLLISGLAFLTAISSLMTHLRSSLFWDNIPQMAFIQFPWRFLGLTAFFLAFISGSISLSKGFFTKLFLISSVLLTIILNYKYFIPVHYSRKVTEEQKLTGIAYELQQKSAILDYLPKTATIAPESKAFERPKVLHGDMTVGEFSKNSYSFSFDVDVYNSGAVEVPIMYFPGWKVFVDNKEVKMETHGAHGLIKINFNNGRHQAYGLFTNTPVRNISNMVSLSALGVLMFVIILSKKHEKDIKQDN